jgi:hypothetical protein
VHLAADPLELCRLALRGQVRVTDVVEAADESDLAIFAAK